MDQKTKFIIFGLVGFSVICLFLFMQATNSQQMLTRERNELKTENFTLASKVEKLENDLKGNQGRIDALKAEKDKAVASMGDLQKKLDLATKSRDELVEKLKAEMQKKQEAAPAATIQEAAPQNTDAYWGNILKGKTDLEMQLASVRDELRNLQVSNEALQREKSGLEVDINSLRIEKQDYIRQLEYNQKLLDSMSQEVVRERNDKAKIQDNFQTLKSENVALARQLKSLNSRKMALDKRIQELQEGRADIGKRLNQVEGELTDKISQIDNLKTELGSAKIDKSVLTSRGSKDAVELPAIVVRSAAPGPERPSSEEPMFSGKVLAVNAENNFVVIDLGMTSGVKVGDKFNVYRDSKVIASVEVIQARDNISACDIKRINTPIKVGDNIK